MRKPTKKDTMNNMNTLTTIINSINNNIDQEVIENLVAHLDYSNTDAVKTVTEFEDFDLWLSAEENPVNNF